MSKHAEVYACIHAAEFPAQALLRLRPELRERACVVMEGELPLQQVCTLNRRARSLGLVRGMTKVEVDTFSDVIVLRRSRGEEAATKAVLLECVGRFSPRMEDCSDDGAFLAVIDIAGTEGLFGPPETLAQKLLSRARGLGITASIAVSGNFNASVALVKVLTAEEVKVTATGEECVALASLPLTVLDLNREQLEKFSLWGIRTLGMLGSLPEDELIARIGQSGKSLLEMARGEMQHLFRPVEPTFTLTERMELESPVEVLDTLLFVVNLMLEQLICRAMGRMVAVASVSITLELEGVAAHFRCVRPALPSVDRQLWLKLLQLDLEAHPPGAAILAVVLDAEPGSTNRVQLGLFSPQFPETSRLDVTLARIRSIVGDENVGRAVLTDTHRLDGFRMEPFSVSSAESSEVPRSLPHPAMRRMRPAESIFVTLQDARPKTFVLWERRYEVDNAYGPWLTGGEWWSPTRWGCEQWDLVARAQDGAMLCCCLIRRPTRRAVANGGVV